MGLTRRTTRSQNLEPVARPSHSRSNSGGDDSSRTTTEGTDRESASSPVRPGTPAKSPVQVKMEEDLVTSALMQINSPRARE